MDHNLYHEIEDKAQILVDSLPYIRDFNQKIIIISFGCSNILTDEEEQEVMRDVDEIHRYASDCCSRYQDGT